MLLNLFEASFFPSLPCSLAWCACSSEFQVKTGFDVLGQLCSSWRGKDWYPNKTPAIELGNRYWCVLHCSRVPRPAVYTTSRGFFAAVGRVAGNDTIGQGFLTETEARVYFEADGGGYPLQYN